MQIDWFTVTAQVVNFLILVGVLSYFLYRPITEAMEKRNADLAAREAAAKAKEGEADRAVESYRTRLDEWDREKAVLLEKTRAEVEEQRLAWLDEARKEIEGVRLRWKQDVANEQSHFLDELLRRVGRVVHDITRTTLTQLADANLEQQIFEAFLRQLRSVPREDLVSWFGPGTECVVASGFPLSEEQEEQLRVLLRERLGDEVGVRFEQAPEVIGGVALQIGSHEVEWSIRSHLDAIGDLSTRIHEE